MSSAPSAPPEGLGLWAGFLDRMPTNSALAAVRDIEDAGVAVIWLQEYSGVDPFVRGALYLQATQQLSVALGVATIHARDPEAMVSAAAALHEAFPGRFHLGLGYSHAHLAAARGASYARPVDTMREYLMAMDAAAGRRPLPARFLGALGPRMSELAGTLTQGVHTYFCPVAHTAGVRAALGPSAWIAPTQLVAISGGPGWQDEARGYLALCLNMPNYRANLRRLGFTDVDIDTVADRLIEALVVPDSPAALADRVAAQRAAGADHVVLQLVPPPSAGVVLDRVAHSRTGVVL